MRVRSLGCALLPWGQANPATLHLTPLLPADVPTTMHAHSPLITTYPHYITLLWLAGPLPYLVWCIACCWWRQVMELELVLGKEDGMGTDRLVHWCGAQLQVGSGEPCACEV